MFTVFAFLSALLSVSAFMPAARVSRVNSLKMAFEKEAGKQMSLMPHDQPRDHANVTHRMPLLFYQE